MKAKRMVQISLLVAAVSVLAGCETAYMDDTVIDASAVGRNEVKVAVADNVKAVNQAVETVCKDLNLDCLSYNLDLLIGKYVYRTAHNDNLTIFTRATSAISTEVRIQFDYNSDPSQPNNIMERLQDYSVYRVAFAESADASPVAVN